MIVAKRLVIFNLPIHFHIITFYQPLITPFCLCILNIRHFQRLSTSTMTFSITSGFTVMFYKIFAISDAHWS